MGQTLAAGKMAPLRIIAAGLVPRRMARNKADTVYGARWQAQLAARTFAADHRMHELGGPHNGVYGANLQALCTTYAQVLVDDRNLRRAVLAVGGI
jgi:hypothetical protein